MLQVPGYHAELICLTPYVNAVPPTDVSCLALSANFGLMAYGNGEGLVVVDTVQYVCLLNMGESLSITVGLVGGENAVNGSHSMLLFRNRMKDLQ